MWGIFFKKQSIRSFYFFLAVVFWLVGFFALEVDVAGFLPFEVDVADVFFPAEDDFEAFFVADVFDAAFLAAGFFIPPRGDFAGAFFTSFFSLTGTKFSTSQLITTDCTASPGFTSTAASPRTAARLRTGAASRRVDLGARLSKWTVAI